MFQGFEFQSFSFDSQKILEQLSPCSLNLSFDLFRMLEIDTLHFGSGTVKSGFHLTTQNTQKYEGRFNVPRKFAKLMTLTKKNTCHAVTENSKVTLH